jgi:hypothetical protein
MFGAPIEVRPYHTRPGGTDGEPDHPDVERLTAQITESLRAVSPEFATVDDRDTFRAAARVTLQATDRGRDPAFGEVERLARGIAAAPVEARRRVTSSFERFAQRLVLMEITARDLVSRSTSAARLVVSVAALGLFGSVLLTATLIHLPALLIVVGATARIRSTATKGTVRLLVGAVAGLLTWIVAGIVIADGWWAVLAGLLVAVEGMLALLVLPPLIHSAQTVVGRLRLRSRGSQLDQLVADRALLVDAVHDAVDHEQ